MTIFIGIAIIMNTVRIIKSCKMDILMLAGIFHPDRIDEIKKKSNGSIQFAADQLQKLILKGIGNNNVNISLINSPFLLSYPQYKDIYIPELLYECNENKYYVDTSFVNLPVIRLFHKEFELKKHIKYWIKRRMSNKIILIYALYSPFLAAAIYAKRIDPSIKICVIVPDMPEFMSDRKSFFYLLMKRIEQGRIKKYMSYIDGCIGLTDYMREPLGFMGRPFLRMEGIADSQINSILTEKVQKNKNRVILYSGTLASRYGIKKLVDAFMLVSRRDAELWILGSGDAEEYIVLKSRIDKRIQLLGQRQNSEVKQLQKQATILVNPRTNDGDYTKYSFPSKTMEYLASGTPTILYELPGIPKEYFEYCFTLKDTSIEALATEISNVLMMDSVELNLKGVKAQQFVLDSKNEIIQGVKILNFLKTL